MRKPKVKEEPTIAPSRLNHHIVGCLDSEASKDYRQVVYSRVPYNASAIRFLCRACSRFHVWYLDPALRQHSKRMN